MLKVTKNLTRRSAILLKAKWIDVVSIESVDKSCLTTRELLA
jgi:hypothetical protein